MARKHPKRKATPLARIKRFQKAQGNELPLPLILDDQGPGLDKETRAKLFERDPQLPISMDLSKGVVLELNRIEGLIELQPDAAARAPLETYARGLREYKDEIAFALVERGETTKQDLEELYTQWFKEKSMTNLPGAQGTTGQKIDMLRKECGWTFDTLSAKTGIDRTTILGHVNKGKTPRIGTLMEYADAFAKALGRAITPLDFKK